MENIEKVLLEISKTLKEIRDTMREQLDLEKVMDLRDTERYKGFPKMSGIITDVLGKEGQIRDEVLKMMGIKEEIKIDNLEGIEEITDQDDPETET
ncbi:hypothetical protein LCGC14_0950070 [marine sediment metagenome]|uniref:Uncharacterized protein n=1 Tax=marine sediment metagenome TaxID=412755 RepID=A0A0F9NHK9_9ZZZZ